MTNIYNEISSHLVNELAANIDSLIMHALEQHTGLPFKQISTDEIIMSLHSFYTRNEHGIWCNFCGFLIAVPHQFNDDVEYESHEPDCCDECGAPDEINPDAF